MSIHQRFSLSALVLACCLTLTLGCASTRSDRIEQRQDAFDTYSPTVQSMIRAGDIDTGFDPEMVQMSMGEPSGVTTILDDDGPVTLWTFRRGWSERSASARASGESPFSAILGFRNGRLAHAFLFSVADVSRER